MMPLIMADPGEENIIRRVGGSPEMKNIWRTWDLPQEAPLR